MTHLTLHELTSCDLVSSKLNICHDCVPTASGKYRPRSTDSADYVLPRTINLVNSVSATPVRLPSDLHTLLTLIPSANNSELFDCAYLPLATIWRLWTFCRHTNYVLNFVIFLEFCFLRLLSVSTS